MFRFTIRDVLWLTVVVAMALGWWIDQDRIRRQSEELKTAAQRLQALPLRHAAAAMRVVQAEFAALVEIKQRNPAAVSESELRRLEMQLDVAKLDMEKARAKEEFATAEPNP